MKWTLETLIRPAFELLDTMGFFFMPAMGDKLPDQTVKNWTVRGFLHPVMGKRGKKDVRRYTAADLLRIYIASRLVWQHTSVTAAFIAADCGVERVEGFIKSGRFPSQPEEEHWITFRDNGETSHRYTGNAVTNFWVEPAYFLNGIVHAPLMPRMEWEGADYDEKFEFFNLDRAIKRFFETFYDVDIDANLQAKITRMVDRYTMGAPTQFDEYMDALEARMKEEASEDENSPLDPDRPS